MQEVRCRDCNKLLARGRVSAEFVCPRCKLRGIYENGGGRLYSILSAEGGGGAVDKGRGQIGAGRGESGDRGKEIGQRAIDAS